MKNILTLLLLLSSLTIFGQQMTWEDWEAASETDIRLLPKYGNKEKTPEQKIADRKFIITSTDHGVSRQKAFDDLIAKGFGFLYRDIKTAMYRFNQAYLLDPTNSDIYWAYGGVYMVLGNFQKAKEQYEEGLSLDPENTNLLTDYGTYFMVQYQAIKPVDEKAAANFLKEALTHLNRSFELDPKNQNTLFKLSVLHMENGDCKNAWSSYDACMALGGRPIPKGYGKSLLAKCEREE